MNPSKDDIDTFQPYTLEYPYWLWWTGFAKGLHHDRQSLGIIVPAGGTFSVRRSSAIDAVLEMDLLNNRGSTETYLRVTGEWTTVTVPAASVPFIRTPYIPGEVHIEFSSVGHVLLPTYRTPGDVELFFQQWDKTESAFALIETMYANLLVPAIDKIALKALLQTEGADALEIYYRGVFEYFNQLAGIAFNAPVRTDKNIHNRYFIKADIDGGGYAYYGHNWTAQTGGSIAPCWLNTSPDNWCALHEIPHGYQTLAMYNSSVRTGEVWNNIYATYYQHKMMGESVYARGWMYGGNAQATFDSMRSRIDSAVPVAEWHLHELLFVFMLIIDKVGEAEFTEFNQYYRRLANAENFNYLDHPLIDMLMSRWADRAHVDIGPFMAQVGAGVSESVLLKNFYGNFQPCCPLHRVVPPDQLADIQKRLNLKTPMSLVDCKSLQVTDLKGDLTLIMTDQCFLEYKNKSLVLRTGSNISRTLKVISPTLKLVGLPVGVYNLLPPVTPRSARVENYRYVEVAANMNNLLELEGEPARGTTWSSQSIDFMGLNGKFATLSVDVLSHRATFDVVSSAPHSYFGSTIYASVLVNDINGFVLCDVELPGVGAAVARHEFSIAPGCTVLVHHEEPSRLLEIPKLERFIDPTAVDNKLYVTSQGFENAMINSCAGDNLKLRISAAADEVRKSPHIILHAGSVPVMDILMAINTFECSRRKEVLESCKDIFVNYAETGGPVVASKYMTWRLPGNGDRTVAEVKINTSTQQISIEVQAGFPHAYFPIIYISIWVRAANGEVLFSQELRGTVSAEANYVTLPFVKGSTVSVLHMESVRSVLLETDTQVSYPVKQVHVIRALGDNKLQV